MNNLDNRTAIRRSLALALLMAIVAGPTLAQGPAQFSKGLKPAPTGQTSNFIQFSLGVPSVDGSAAQYMQRHRVPDALWGGIEELHLERFVGERGILLVDGRAIPGNDDYRVKVALDVPDVGYARVGLENFKVRYDGAGGYFVPLDRQFTPADQELAIDRGTTFIEAGLRKPDLPKLTVRFARMFRDGTKPSLSWGDSRDLDDLGTRNISPSFWVSDDSRNTLTADVEHTFGKTDVSIGASLESGEADNSLNIWRRPGESSERFLTDRETIKSDALSVHAGTVTQLGEGLSLATRFIHQTAENEYGGNRIYGATFGAAFDAGFPNGQRRDHGFLDIDGVADRTMTSVGAELRMRKGDFTVVPAIRYETMNRDGEVKVTDTNVQSDGSVTLTPLRNSGNRDLTDVTGSLEVRFTGIDNLTLYTRGEYIDRSGSIFEQEVETETSSVEFSRETDDTRSSYRVLGGFNWHPSTMVRVNGQAYRKLRSVTYDHFENADGPLTYPGFLQSQDYTTDDANIQIRLRPDARVTLSARLDVRRTINEGTADGLDTFESAEITSRALTGTVAFKPNAQSFIRAQVSSSRNRFVTPINELTGDAADIVLEARSDYLNASVSAGAAVSEKASVEARLFYFEADNFIDNSDVGHPYAISAEEQGVTLGGSYEVRPGMTTSVRFYHFLNRDGTFGGTQDYDLNAVFLSLGYRF